MTSTTLKAWRKARGWSQIEAATFFARFGPCSRRTYQRWEDEGPPQWAWSIARLELAKKKRASR